MAVGGEADRAIDWGERALRLSPFDPHNFGPCFAITFGQFQRGDYEAAAEAARKCFQANPNWSAAHMLLAATQARLGRVDAAMKAANRAGARAWLHHQRVVRRPRTPQISRGATLGSASHGRPASIAARGFSSTFLPFGQLAPRRPVALQSVGPALMQRRSKRR